MVQRRHEHLDVLLLDDPDALEQVLLGEPVDRHGPLRRAAGEVVDELVDAGCADDAGRRPRQHLPAREPHVEFDGWIRTSEPSSRLR